MACDGDIAADEIDLLRGFFKEDESWKDFDVQSILNNYIIEINERGGAFLVDFLRQVADADLDDDSALKLVDVAIRMIEADNKVEYSEVKFFKRIRQELKVSDEKLYDTFPDKDVFFLPDITAPDELNWNASFDALSLKI